MKYVHFEASGILAGLAAMLEPFGIDVEDHQIALDMEAPWLIIREDGCFRAGQGLYTPRWMNLCLHPRGLHLHETRLPKEDVPAFLRSHHPAMLTVQVTPAAKHPAVFTQYADGRYAFANVKTENSPEPDVLSLTRPMLLRRLDDEVHVLTLESRPPEEAALLPLLIQSLHTLTDYERELLSACTRTVTRDEFRALHTPLMRALMVDMLPMAQLANQPVLHEELRYLHHDYRHVFTRNSPPEVTLWERLPRSSIRICISWMRENIVDRLYAHGATDEQVEALLADVKHRR